MHSVRLTLASLATGVFLKLYPTRQLEGIRVVFTDLEIDRDVGITRLKESLHVLGETDRLKYRQVLRYVRTIYVWAGHYSSANPPESINLCSAHLMSSTQIELASVLVHEAVHLRIARQGIRYEERLQERIERRCIREQVSFLRKQGSKGVAMAAVFESALNSPWWTDEANQRDIERLVSDARMPRWMIPVMGGRRARKS